MPCEKSPSRFKNSRPRVPFNDRRLLAAGRRGRTGFRFELEFPDGDDAGAFATQLTNWKPGEEIIARGKPSLPDRRDRRRRPARGGSPDVARAGRSKFAGVTTALYSYARRAPPCIPSGNGGNPDASAMSTATSPRVRPAVVSSVGRRCLTKPPIGSPAPADNQAP